VLGEQVHGVEHVAEDRLAHQVAEADPDEAELRAEVAALALGRHAGGPVVVDVIEAMEVGPGAEAPATGLDAGQVAEQRDDEVVVQRPRRVAQPERDDRQPRGDGMAEELDAWVRAPRGQRAPREVVLSRRPVSSVPISSLSANTRPARTRIDSTMARVPPSSRSCGSGS
jgi:hypothetical protein